MNWRLERAQILTGMVQGGLTFLFSGGISFALYSYLNGQFDLNDHAYFALSLATFLSLGLWEINRLAIRRLRQISEQQKERLVDIPGLPPSANEEIREWYAEVGALLSIKETDHSQLKRELADMERKLDEADVPYVATRGIRDRIDAQANRSDSLHAKSVRQTQLFQWMGILAVVAGLGLVGSAAYAVIFRNLDPEKVKVVAPVAGLVFNAVGGGLLLFHRATAQSARYYFDSKQDLDNLLTALELMTNRVMQEKTADMMPELIRKLYAHAGRSRGYPSSKEKSEVEVEKKDKPKTPQPRARITEPE